MAGLQSSNKTQKTRQGFFSSRVLYVRLFLQNSQTETYLYHQWLKPLAGMIEYLKGQTSEEEALLTDSKSSGENRCCGDETRDKH